MKKHNPRVMKRTGSEAESKVKGGGVAKANRNQKVAKSSEGES